jgi:hypothetical protein
LKFWLTSCRTRGTYAFISVWNIWIRWFIGFSCSAIAVIIIGDPSDFSLLWSPFHPREVWLFVPFPKLRLGSFFILQTTRSRFCLHGNQGSFTCIHVSSRLSLILSVKIVPTLRVKLPCRKCKILNVREIFVFSH